MTSLKNLEYGKYKKLNAIAFTITDGDLSKVDLLCPFCQKGDLIFSFARSKPPRYSLFLVCTKCGHQQHYILGSKPKNFQDDLVLVKYQALEDQLVKFAE